MNVSSTVTVSVFFVEPQIRQPIEQAISAFPSLQAQRLGSTTTSNLLTTAPSLVFQPVNYTLANLRPFDIQAYVHANASVYPDPANVLRQRNCYRLRRPHLPANSFCKSLTVEVYVSY